MNCYAGTNYYYKLNLQGDVIGLINTSGAEVVGYTYDAWGKQLTCTGSLASTLGAKNPLRYRGYIYDTETGLYYLQSRYYNPTWGRFISADTVLGAIGRINTQNIFAYCLNDPVNYSDPSGCNPITDFIRRKVIASGGNEIEADLAVKHPFQAIAANKCREKAYKYAKQFYGEEWNADGTMANAFKHAFWNALMADEMGEEMAKEFADAHEAVNSKSNDPNIIDHTNMDYANNELGRSIKREKVTHVIFGFIRITVDESDEEFALRVKDIIEKEGLVIIE
jgi:RHS repeat-associated protein